MNDKPVTSFLTTDIAATPISNAFNDITLLSDSGHNLVYRAFHQGKFVTLKAPKLDDGESERNKALLQREYDMLCAVQQMPYIVSAWQMTDVPGVGTCIVMEYVDGRTLTDFMAEKPQLSMRRQVLDELLQAVEYLHHKQIVHADIKPQNILITHNGNHVKLIDLGMSDNDAWREKNIGSTPPFAAPEQLAGKTTDFSADIYALGIILRLLFPYRYPLVVRRCLQVNPERRYRSVAALRSAVNGYWRNRLLVLLFLTAITACVVYFHSAHDKNQNSTNSAPDKGMQHEVPEGANSSAPNGEVSQSNGGVSLEELYGPDGNIDNTSSASDGGTRHKVPEGANSSAPNGEVSQSDGGVQSAYSIAAMEQIADRQHRELRDECVQKILGSKTMTSAEANSYVGYFRDKSYGYMMQEIRRYPEHEMEIAHIYDAADRRYIYDILDATRKRVPENIYYDSLRQAVGAMYDNALRQIKDSMNRSQYKYRDFIRYYKKRYIILAQYATDAEKERRPDMESDIRTIYHNARLDFEKAVKVLEGSYPELRDACDSGTISDDEKQRASSLLNAMHSRAFDRQ